MLLNKNNLQELLINKRQSRIVSIDDFDVRLLAMTLDQQLKIEALSKESKGNNHLVNAMLQFSCVDEAGSPLFGSDDEVNSIPANIAVRLFTECLAINGIDDKALESKAKN